MRRVVVSEFVSRDGVMEAPDKWHLQFWHAFTNWFGAVGSPNHYKGKFSEDRNTVTGAWEWPGGGYEATMIRIE